MGTGFVAVFEQFNEDSVRIDKDSVLRKKKHLLKMKLFYNTLLTVSGSRRELSIISRHIHRKNNETKKENELPDSTCMEDVLHYWRRVTSYIVNGAQ
jgi:hypothetical protein